MRFTDFLPETCVLPELGSRDRSGVLREVSEALGASTHLPPDWLLEQFEARERLCSTAVGHGLAIPHCRAERLRKSVVCVAVRRDGADFGARDGDAVRLFVAIASPVQPVSTHLSLLARIAALLRDPRLREAVIAAPSAAHIRALFVRAEDAYLAPQHLRHAQHA